MPQVVRERSAQRPSPGKERNVTQSNGIAVRIAALVIGLSFAAPAAAIPAFARKYATSCQTCHTVYPKLSPFGEAFRRNGYRFPGIDSDLIKAEQIPMGQEANKKTFPTTTWPDAIPTGVPLSVGANGQAIIYPKKTSSAAQAANGTQFTMQDLAPEAHLWAGASLDDTITLWAELTFADGGADVEHAQVLFNDLVGPKHAVNLIVGHGFPNVTQYGPHSSYLSDSMLPVVPVTAIYQGEGNPWVLVNNYTGAEVNGVIAGRVDYAVGLNAGVTNGINSTDNFYGRIGFKLGGLALDGESGAGTGDTTKPWAENALGVYAFGYQANARLSAANPVNGAINDVANIIGVGARGQYGSAELNLGWYSENHNHGTDAGGKVTSSVGFAELSYVVFPWLVPVLRIESASLKPDGGLKVSDLHVQPGVAFLIRPNMKLVATFDYETANGFANAGGTYEAWQGGSSGWGPLQIAPADATVGAKRSEFESIGLFFAWAM
jgi:hypothetical protein